MNRIVILGGLGAHLAPEVMETKKRAQIRERRPENKVEVTQGVNDLHPLVERTRKKLESAKPGENKLVTIKEPSFFNVSIGPENIDRVVLFLNALVSAAEGRGYKLEKRDSALHFIVENEVLPFRVVEGTDRIRHEPTDKEKNALEKWKRQHHRRSLDWRLDNWLSRPEIPEWDRVPNNKLAFRIDEDRYDGLRRTFADGKTQRIETLINAVLVGLATCSAAKKAQREENERRRRECEEQQRRAENMRRKQALEKKRIEALCEDLTLSRKRQEILGYIAIVERKMEQADTEERLAASKWLKWARSYADHLDPLRERLPVLPEFEDFEPWELR